MGAIEDFMRDIGADTKGHSGRTLKEHLQGTAALLVQAGAPFEVVLAGMLHSIYGTNAFNHISVPSSERGTVRRKFGRHVERLVYLFHALNRPRAIEDHYDHHRITGESLGVTDAEWEALVLIEYANLVEQKPNRDMTRYPRIKSTWESYVRRNA